MTKLWPEGRLIDTEENRQALLSRRRPGNCLGAAKLSWRASRSDVTRSTSCT